MIEQPEGRITASSRDGPYCIPLHVSHAHHVPEVGEFESNVHICALTRCVLLSEGKKGWGGLTISPVLSQRHMVRVGAFSVTVSDAVLIITVTNSFISFSHSFSGFISFLVLVVTSFNS